MVNKVNTVPAVAAEEFKTRIYLKNLSNNYQYGVMQIGARKILFLSLMMRKK